MKAVPLYIQEIVYTKLKAAYKRNQYILRGTAGPCISASESAHHALIKLTGWAVKNGSKIIVIRDDFDLYPNSSKEAGMRITLVISTPASTDINELIISFRDKLHSPPQERAKWTRYREKCKMGDTYE